MISFFISAFDHLKVRLHALHKPSRIPVTSYFHRQMCYLWQDNTMEVAGSGLGLGSQYDRKVFHVAGKQKLPILLAAKAKCTLQANWAAWKTSIMKWYKGLVLELRLHKLNPAWRKVAEAVAEQSSRQADAETMRKQDFHWVASSKILCAYATRKLKVGHRSSRKLNVCARELCVRSCVSKSRLQSRGTLQANWWFVILKFTIWFLHATKPTLTQPIPWYHYSFLLLTI